MRRSGGALASYLCVALAFSTPAFAPAHLQSRAQEVVTELPTEITGLIVLRAAFIPCWHGRRVRRRRQFIPHAGGGGVACGRGVAADLSENLRA